jgi:murein DD-endopeptidase MepM/ murein hydrolase activator NlpD
LVVPGELTMRKLTITLLGPVLVIVGVGSTGTGCVASTDDPEAPTMADDGSDTPDATENVEKSSSALSGRPSFEVPYRCGFSTWGQTRSNHSPQRAVDFGLGYGSRVDASAGGTISYGNRGTTSYGKYLVIDHGNGWSTLYAHLSSPIRTSGYVSKGDPIGWSGSTGHSSGPHLHYEQRLNGSAVSIVFSSGPSPAYYGTKTYTGGCS